MDKFEKKEITKKRVFPKISYLVQLMPVVN